MIGVIRVRSQVRIHVIPIFLKILKVLQYIFIQKFIVKKSLRSQTEAQKSQSSETIEASKSRHDSEIQGYMDEKLNTKNSEILRLQKIIAEHKINESNHQTGRFLKSKIVKICLKQAKTASHEPWPKSSFEQSERCPFLRHFLMIFHNDSL